jgi:hypothetical protein
VKWVDRRALLGKRSPAKVAKMQRKSKGNLVELENYARKTKLDINGAVSYDVCSPFFAKKARFCLRILGMYVNW